MTTRRNDCSWVTAGRRIRMKAHLQALLIHQQSNNPVICWEPHAGHKLKVQHDFFVMHLNCEHVLTSNWLQALE